MLKITQTVVIALLALPGLARAQSTPAKDTPNPSVEVAFGFNGPQYWTAEFPGITLAGAANVQLGQRAGVGLVGELDGSYARVGKTIGGRIYARTAATDWRLTGFAQILVGYATGGDEGIIHSVGGSVVQPGVGIMFGTRRRSIQIQWDHRRVNGGYIHDGQNRRPDEPMSGRRTTISFVWGIGLK